MAVSVAHPRRRSQAGAASQVPSALDALRKSETFNARTRISTELVTPFEAASLMPKRSPTNPKSLEELLAEGENHVEYISKLLRDFNLAWKSDKPLAADASILNDREVHAVPTLSQPIDIANDKLATASREHHHDSDSGLGTSVDTIVDGMSCVSSHPRGVCHRRTDVDAEKELVARFIPSRSPARTPHTSHFFSKASVQQIKKHIVQPILDEPALKEFHPLIEDIPARIGRKFITNLRDLEKTLLFLAPVSDGVWVFACSIAYRYLTQKDYASSPAKFLQFCETSIECLQTTVDLISERDQRKPTDRPYTNNYFVDLVDQIRRYAEIMRHTREKKERGEPLDEMDYSPYVFPDPVQKAPRISTSVLGTSSLTPARSRTSTAPHFLVIQPRESSHDRRAECKGHLHHIVPIQTDSRYSSPFTLGSHTDSTLHSDEEIAISGGLSQNGRPAELIRTKNGKAIALSNNTIIEDMEEGTSSKRPLTDADIDEDEVFRSMARRRKSEKPGDVVHVCRACDKEFKRPCDLTKHEKTHSRPWKCDEPTCKYHTLGWPTEKEMQRHWNDKHSTSPQLYKCHFPPCTYSSKRESNCKQHMEKTHAWDYKKSKHNGRKKAPQTSGSPFTPLTPFMSTPASYNTHLVTPQEPFAPSPALPMMAAPFDTFNFNQFPPTPTMSIGAGARRDSAATSSAHSVGTYSSNFVSPQQVVATSFEDIMGSGDTMLDQSLNMLVPPMFQQPTPAISVNNNFGTDWPGFAKASPVDALAQPGTLEYSMVNPLSDGPSNLASPPSVNFEENVNFDDAIAGSGFGDFQLYGSPAPAPGEAGPSNYHQMWFPETSDVINNQFDEWGNYIGPGFDHVL